MLSGKTYSTPPSEPTLFKKARSRSDVTSNTMVECGIIMVHRGVLQQKIATHQCKRLGYHPIVIELPTSEDDELASFSIKRLLEALAVETRALQVVGKSILISYILVDANYSHVGSPIPNFALIAFMRDKLGCKSIFASSFTLECINALKNNEAFSDIYVAQDPTEMITDIMTKDQPVQRKHSLGM